MFVYKSKRGKLFVIPLQCIHSAPPAAGGGRRGQRRSSHHPLIINIIITVNNV